MTALLQEPPSGSLAFQEDADAIDKAIALRGFADSYGYKQRELASLTGLDRSTISNLIRLLDLPEEIQDAVRSKKISPCHARTLLGLPDSVSQIATCRRIINESLSVRQAEELVATGELAPRRERSPSPGVPMQGVIEKELTLAEVEARHIKAVMLNHGGKKREVAEVLGISLKSLYNKINTAPELAEWRPR